MLEMGVLEHSVLTTCIPSLVPRPSPRKETATEVSKGEEGLVNMVQINLNSAEFQTAESDWLIGSNDIMYLCKALYIVSRQQLYSDG